MLELKLLPAKQGDAIWLSWSDGDKTRQLIVDMGTTGTGTKLRQQLAELPAERRAFELLVVTHIDADHIGGVLSCLVDKGMPEGVEIKDIWFNGLDHLEAVRRARPRTLEEFGGVQGKKLMDWLTPRKWNEAFGRGPIVRSDTELPTTKLPGGLSISVLGPTAQRLIDLEPVWKSDIQAALRRKEAREEEREEQRRLAALAGRMPLEPYGSRKPPDAPTLADKAALTALAAGAVGKDTSKPNGSSIALLVEYRGRRILLSGDAYAQDLVAGLALVDGGKCVALDAFKLPHHGSRDNTTADMIKAVDCPLYLFSTDGTQFFHPDAACVACVIEHGRGGRETVELGFNRRSVYNNWWDNQDWRDSFGYTTRYGGDDDGLTLTFAPAPGH